MYAKALENQNIILPDTIVRDNVFTNKTVSMSHIYALVNAQESDEIILAPHLTVQNIHPGQFRKIRVQHATSPQVFVIEKLLAH